MQFSVVELFNYKALGLDAPHYAVVADMPADMGGGQRVVDMFAVADVARAGLLCEAFARAKDQMPHRLSPEGGGEIDFYARDYSGHRVKQSTAYIPARSLTGEHFEEALLNWLSWRARVGLWLQDRPRPALPAETQARILSNAPALSPHEQPPALRSGADAWALRVVPQKRNDYLADQTPAPLTRGLAPL